MDLRNLGYTKCVSLVLYIVYANRFRDLPKRYFLKKGEEYMSKIKDVLLTKREKIESRLHWRFTMRVGKFLVNHKKIFNLLTYTWGLINVIIGWLVLLVLLPFGKFIRPYNKSKNMSSVQYLNGLIKGTISPTDYGYFVFNKRQPWGFSIGSIIFVGHTHNSMLKHEYGHRIHNAIYGPFTLIIIGLPSVIRFWYREISKNTTTNYDDIWFEGTATKLGEYHHLKNNEKIQIKK